MSGRRPGLGRGLDALLKTDEPINRLSLDRLVPNRLQPRSAFDEEALAELAASIRAQGLVQPIVVTPRGDDHYIIVAGERRFRAARLAGLQEVPVVVREVRDDRQLLEMALVENLQRSDLNPVEEAEAYRALQQDFGLSQEEIAVRVGKGRATVSNALRLLRLPEEVLELLRARRLSAGQARPLVSVEGESRQVELARRAAERGLTARDLERLASAPARKRQAPEREVDVHAAQAAETLTRALQTKVEIHRAGRGGSIRLHFFSEEELMRLYELLMRARR